MLNIQRISWPFYDHRWIWESPQKCNSNSEKTRWNASAKTVPSGGKVMVSVFWNAKGILLIDYQMRRVCFWSILRNIFEEVKSSNHGKTFQNDQKKDVVLWQCTGAFKHYAQPKLTELKFDIFLHPYSPDPSDFHLFPNSKFFLVERDLSEEVINNYFKDLEETHVQKGIGNLEKHWGKCNEFRGNCIEK